MSPRRLRVLIAPDKFTGSLTAAQVARAIGAGMTGADVALLPLADGGDGSVAAALAAGFTPVPVRVSGDIGAEIAVHDSQVLVELANTCGIGTLAGGVLEPLGASTRGLGDAVAAALRRTPGRIVIALGGSASTDGGAGLLAALGARFLDAQERVIEPSGGTLGRIARVDLSGLADLGRVELVCATDVRNPLLGPTGAAAVFAPQKGASSAMVEQLEGGLVTLVTALRRAGLDADPSAVTPGAGAAGGAGFGCLLLGSRIVSGAHFFLDLLDFDRRAAAADLVITGEGSLDEQTASGKLVSAIAARSGSTPVVAAVGRNRLSSDESRALGLSAVYSTTDRAGADTATDAALTAATLTAIGRAVAAQFSSSTRLRS